MTKYFLPLVICLWSWWFWITVKWGRVMAFCVTCLLFILRRRNWFCFPILKSQANVNTTEIKNMFQLMDLKLGHKTEPYLPTLSSILKNIHKFYVRLLQFHRSSSPWQSLNGHLVFQGLLSKIYWGAGVLHNMQPVLSKTVPDWDRGCPPLEGRDLDFVQPFSCMGGATPQAVIR